MKKRMFSMLFSFVLFALPVCIAHAESEAISDELEDNIWIFIAAKNEYAPPETEYDAAYFNSKKLCGADDTVTSVEKLSPNPCDMIRYFKLNLSPSKQNKDNTKIIIKELLTDSRISEAVAIAEDKNGSWYNPFCIYVTIKDEYTAPKNVYDTVYFNGIINLGSENIIEAVEPTVRDSNRYFQLHISNSETKNINKIITELSKDIKIERAKIGYFWEPLEQPIYIPGDVDLNNKINSSDARTVLRAAAKLDTLNYLQDILADINGDGNINTADAREILLKTIRRAV